MALTEKRKQELIGALRGSNSSKELILPEYREYLKRAEKTTCFVKVNEQDEIPCYVFASPEREQGCPVYINIHGGGFVQPHAERDEILSARIAAEIKGIAVDLDYSLSPENQFPAAFEESYAAAAWVFSKLREWGADEKKVVIGGHSAGANLTAAICLKAGQTKEFSFCGQVLNYGWLDLATDQAEKKDSLHNKLAIDRCRLLLEAYVGGDMALTENPYCSPMSAPDEWLKSQPDTLILTAGKDAFRHEDYRYGKRLADMGVTVTMKCFRESDHGFLVYGRDEWQKAQALMIEFLKAKMA